MKNKEIVKNLIRIAKELMADSFEDISEKDCLEYLETIEKQFTQTQNKLKDICSKFNVLNDFDVKELWQQLKNGTKSLDYLSYNYRKDSSTFKNQRSIMQSLLKNKNAEKYQKRIKDDLNVMENIVKEIRDKRNVMEDIIDEIYNNRTLIRKKLDDLRK